MKTLLIQILWGPAEAALQEEFCGFKKVRNLEGLQSYGLKVQSSRYKNILKLQWNGLIPRNMPDLAPEIEHLTRGISMKHREYERFTSLGPT